MGNHEFNAIAYATPRPDAPGEYLRSHSERNEDQHKEFLGQVREGSALHQDLVRWFKTLPVAIDLGPIRVVHAWWHAPHIAVMPDRAAGDALSEEFMVAACTRGSPEWEAIEGLTKGLEIDLPEGASFQDHAGVERHQTRARWWDGSARTFRDAAIVPAGQMHKMPDHPLPSPLPGAWGTPVFVGHYWMPGSPCLQSPLVACVDYSAALDGPLVCYRWQGEDELDARQFVEAF